MSDTSQNPADDAGQVPVRILGQFIKDLSFEVPNAPEIYNVLRETQPDIPITLDTSMRHISGSTYEVILSAQIEATAGTMAAFIFEVAYACIVEINENVIPKEAVHPFLMIEIPRLIFPFVRQLVSEMTVGGGFPPLMLQVIDFGELYRRKFGVIGQPVENQAPAGAAIN